MNWREKIEAQIAEATEHGDPLDMVYIEVHAPVLQALLDVAVAADWASAKIEGGISEIDAALDKLREVE